MPRKGRGEAIINGGTHAIKATPGIVLPGVARHDLRSADEAVTLYGRPDHLEHLVQQTRAWAEASNEIFDGAATK